MQLHIEMKLREGESYSTPTLAQSELTVIGAFFKPDTIESLAKIVAQQLWQQFAQNSKKMLPKATSAEVMPPPEYQPDIEDKLAANLPGEEVSF